MLLFDADKRKGDEPKSSLRARISVSILLTLALLAYVAFELFLIYNDGLGGFSVRTTVYTMQTYLIPDVVFCSDTNQVMTYKCDTLLTDGSRVADACTSYFPQTSTRYSLFLNSSFHFCYGFRTKGQIFYDQWNDSGKGIKSIQFTVSVPPGQVAPSHIEVQFFAPDSNFYAKNLIEGAYEDTVEIQAARVQNKYTITSGTQMSTLFTTSLHQQLSRSDSLAILGLGFSSLTNQHFLDSSSDKLVQQTQYAQQGIYGVVNLEPATYNTVVLQDQRRFTILTALGLLGGAYGAFASLFFFLFGEKQINPVGIVTRFWRPQKPIIDPYPTSPSMQQHNLLAGQMNSPSPQDNDTILPGPATQNRKSVDSLEKGGVRRQLSQKHVNFIETRDELTIEQRIQGIERLLNDYVVNLDQIGIRTLGNY